MQKSHYKTKIITALLWKFMERVGSQGIQFLVQIVLARLLLPEDFGIIAIVSVFITLANVFIQNGFNTALIQKKHADDIDFSSVFYLNLISAGILYVFIFSISPYVADFYNMPTLELILRVLSIILFFGAINSVQNAFVGRNMMFKKLFISSSGAFLVSGTVGVITAYLGWGVWALVIQQLVNQLVITIILWFTVKWRPHLVFSFNRIKTLLSFGWKILAASLLNVIQTDLRTLLIGKFFNPNILGYYNRGMQFPQIFVNNIDGSIQAVMLPALSSHQDNLNRVKDMMRRAMMTSSLIIFPMMIGLAFIAEPLVNIILTDKWAPAVPFLQIYCLIYALRPINTANVQAINALGRSDIFLKLEVVRTVIGIIILIVTVPFGIYTVALGALVNSVISAFIYVYPNAKLLDYSVLQQCKDILPPILISIIMGLGIYTINYLTISSLILIILQVIVGISLYIGLAVIFKVDSFNYLIKSIMEIKKGNNERR